jgi:hypothetical protein
VPRQSKTPLAEDLEEGFQGGSGRRHTSSLPSQSPSENTLEHEPSGRTEKRLPIIVVVRLARCEPGRAVGEERTFTDNISPHGARVFSKHLWRPGDAVQVTPLNDDSVSGKVVYSQKLSDDRYSIGLKFQGRPVVWSVLQRYGVLIG